MTNAPLKTNEMKIKGLGCFGLVPKKHRNRKSIELSKKFLKSVERSRAGVENLMGLMHRGEKHTGKLKVRGLFNFALYGFAMGVVINFERIFRYLNTENNCFLTFWHSLASSGGSYLKKIESKTNTLCFVKYIVHILI